MFISLLDFRHVDRDEVRWCRRRRNPARKSQMSSYICLTYKQQVVNNLKSRRMKESFSFRGAPFWAEVRPQPTIVPVRGSATQKLQLFSFLMHPTTERGARAYKWIFKRHAVVSWPKTETVDCWLLYFTWKTFKLLLLISQLRPAEMKWGQTRHTAMSQKITHSSSSLHA